MKNLLFLLAVLLIANTGYSQLQVRGMVVTSVPDTIDKAIVYLYSDTSVSTPVVPIRRDTTKPLQGYFFQLPPIPLNTVLYVSTLNCDSQSFVIDTIRYSGQLGFNRDLRVCITPADTFSGFVFLGNKSKRPIPEDAIVRLIQRCPNNEVTELISISTWTNGYFHIAKFPKLSAGCALILQAALTPKSKEYKRYLPAYHLNKDGYVLRWYEANEVKMFAGRDTVNILLPEAMNPTGGPSSISGYATDTTPKKLRDKILMITDMHGVPVDYTFTDADGKFIFPNLPFGTYKVFGDMWTKDNPDLVIKIDADHVHEPRVVFTEGRTEFRGRIATSVAGNTMAKGDMQVYPNPATDNVYISGANHIAGEKQLLLSNLDGSLIQQKQYTHGAEVSISIKDLPDGIYVLKLQTKEGTSIFRITK